MLFGYSPERGVASRQFEHGRQCIRHNNTAGMLKTFACDREGLRSFRRVEPQSRQHLKQMPADLLLVDSRNIMQKRALVRGQTVRIRAGSFLQSIRSTHSDNRIRILHQPGHGSDAGR